MKQNKRFVIIEKGQINKLCHALNCEYDTNKNQHH